MAESRTLEILVKVKDLATKAIGGIGAGISKFATFAQAAFKQVAIGFLRRIGELLLQLPGKLLAAGKAFLQHADDVQKLSAALGTTAESFQALAFAAGQSGLSQEKLADTGKFLVKAMETARQKAGENRHIFRALGVDVDALGDSQLDLVDVYAKIADGINGIESPTERATVLMKLFGRSGHEIALLMAEGGEGIRALAKDAEELGIVLSTRTVANADALGDQINRVVAVFRGLFNTVSNEVMPGITKALEIFVEFVKRNRETIVSVFRAMGRGFLAVLDVIVQGVALFAGAVRESFEAVKIGLKGLEVAFLQGQQFMADWAVAMGGAMTRSGELVRAQLELKELLAGSAKTSVTEYAVAWEKLKEEIANAGLTMGTVSVQAGKVKDSVDSTITDFDRLTESIRSGAQQEVGNFFENIVTGAKSAKEAFKAMVLDILALLARLVAQWAAAQLFTGIGLGPTTAGGGAGPSANAFRPSAQRIGGFGGGSSGFGFGPQGGGGTIIVNNHFDFVSGEGLEAVMARPSMRRRIEDVFINSIRSRRDVRIAIGGI